MIGCSRLTYLASALATAILIAGCSSGGSTRTPTRDAATAMRTMDEEQVQNAQASRIEDVLARVPGLDVIRTSQTGYALRIRGGRGVMGENSEPLLVIDGMPVRSGGHAHVLSSLNPKDIARVEVLKDAGSTAFYGPRGANGVVVITTRRGKQP